MESIRWLRRRVAALVGRASVEREMDEEMRVHLELEIEDRVRSGMSPSEARRTARRDFGAVDRFKEEGREARGIGWLEAFRQDVRFTARSLVKTPGFAVVAVLTLGVGIGATTAIFSVVEGVLLRPLPYPDADRLAWVRQTSADGGMSPFSAPNFRDLRERSQSFSGLASYSSNVVPVSVSGDAARVMVTVASEDFFRVMGVHPLRGRGFTTEEWASGAPVAVVSESYWRTRLGGAADLGAIPIRVGTSVLTVVGVMPEGFDFPDGTGVWGPAPPQGAASRTAHNWQVVGRLRDGVAVAAGIREIDRIAAELKAVHGDGTNMSGATMIPLHERLVGHIRPALLVLLVSAGLLLVIACANVVNLLLARAAGRRRELAVRLALGAGRGRLTRQFLAESLVLSAVGGALGIALTWAGVRALATMGAGRIPRVEEVGVNAPVLVFVIGVTAACAVGLGLFTAFRAARADVREALTDGARSQTGGVGSHRVRAGLTVVQVALTVLLLVGAGLLGRSFLGLMAVDPGYRTSGALVMDLLMPYAADDEEGVRLLRMQDEIIAAIAAAPGVDEVGTVDVLPLSDDGSNGTFVIVDSPDEVSTFEDFSRLANEPGRNGYANYRIASGGYFRAMGIPLVRGRLFDERDHADAPHAALISESLAERQWPDQDPIGRLIQFGNMDGDLRVFTIVGVVGDVRERLDQAPYPTFYGNALQRPRSLAGSHNFVVTGDFDAATVSAVAREAVRARDAEMPIRFRTLDEVFSSSLSARRFSVVLLGAFSLAALLLAVTGIYGLVSYVVAQQTREIGIRLALGAPSRRVLRQVVGRGLVLTLSGIGLGLLAALGATGAMAGLLYGVGVRDLQTFVAVPLLLAAVATLASYLPARRAARVDPMAAIRYD